MNASVAEEGNIKFLRNICNYIPLFNSQCLENASHAIIFLCGLLQNRPLGIFGFARPYLCIMP
jgi:hypothetical protein